MSTSTFFLSTKCQMSTKVKSSPHGELNSVHPACKTTGNWTLWDRNDLWLLLPNSVCNCSMLVCVWNVYMLIFEFWILSQYTHVYEHTLTTRVCVHVCLREWVYVCLHECVCMVVCVACMLDACAYVCVRVRRVCVCVRAPMCVYVGVCACVIDFQIADRRCWVC